MSPHSSRRLDACLARLCEHKANTSLLFLPVLPPLFCFFLCAPKTYALNPKPRSVYQHATQNTDGPKHGYTHQETDKGPGHAIWTRVSAGLRLVLS